MTFKSTKGQLLITAFGAPLVILLLLKILNLTKINYCADYSFLAIILLKSNSEWYGSYSQASKIN
jgi:hypothetical protein